MDITPRTVDEQLHRLMRQQHELLRRYFQRHGLFQGQPPLLHRVSLQPGVTQKELAAQLDVSPASVAVSLRRMEAQGLICRSADKNDGRVQHVELTAHGAAIQAECDRTVKGLIDVLYADFSDKELAAMQGFFQRMRQALERVSADSPSLERTGSVI